VGREHVALGTATDPYQPIEGHYRLTRGAIEALARAKTPVGLVTKGRWSFGIATCWSNSRVPPPARLHEHTDRG